MLVPLIWGWVAREIGVRVDDKASDDPEDYRLRVRASRYSKVFLEIDRGLE